MATQEAPIRARTEGERDAYVAGYVQGALDVHERGLPFAQQLIRLMGGVDEVEVPAGETPSK